jgi:hypothetical protein
MRQTLYTIIMLLKFYIIFSWIKKYLNVKTENYKVVDVIERCNFGVKSILIWQHTQKILFV